MSRILAPIKAMRARYIPLLAVYFSVGLIALASVTSTLFLKNSISLSASDLISLGIWISMPWSIKMVFGSLIDGVSIFGCTRKNYIYLGNILISLGILGSVDHASHRYLIGAIGEYSALLMSGLLMTIGVVISDIVADTMAIEVVPDGPNRDVELGQVQVLSRLALSLGGLIAAGMTGALATHLAPSVVYSLLWICPAITIAATMAISLEEPPQPSLINFHVLIGGLVYGGLCVLAGTLLGEYATLIVFSVAIVVISLMMRSVMAALPSHTIRSFILAMIAIFLFRTVPGIGPAGAWFYIERLGFDAGFLGTLSLVSALSSFAVLWALTSSIANSSIFKTMAVLTLLMTVLSLPDIIVYYGLHETVGISARSVILADTAMVGPLAQISMVPLGVLIARNAPPSQRALYISLTASMMNAALVGGDIITQGLNTLLPVSRTDFSNLGVLMITSLTISTGLSILGLVVLYRGRVS